MHWPRVTQQAQRVVANIIPRRTLSKERQDEQAADLSVTSDGQVGRVSSRQATLLENPWGGRERQCSRYDVRLPPARAPAVADLQAVELGLERLDRAVRELEVLIEAVALLDKLHST